MIEIDSASSSDDTDDDVPCVDRRRLRTYRKCGQRSNAIVVDADVEMEEGETMPSPTADSSLSLPSPKVALPNPPEYHPLAKARNIAAADVMYDSSIRWEVYAILDRANYDKQK